MPRFDTFQHTWILVVLILSDLLLCLLDLLLLELLQVLEAEGNLFQLEICLGRILLVLIVSVVDELAQLYNLFDDILEALLEYAWSQTKFVGVRVRSWLFFTRHGSLRLYSFSLYLAYT